jgi:hypothetical protein
VEKKNKINVEECTYPSTSADNSVTKHEDNGGRDIPECWSLEMFLHKKVEYPWMLVKNRKLGCSICRHISYLRPERTCGIHMSCEWSNTEVCVCGVNVATGQNSWSDWHKKFINKNCETHSVCQKIKYKAEKVQFMSHLKRWNRNGEFS